MKHYNGCSRIFRLEPNLNYLKYIAMKTLCRALCLLVLVFCSVGTGQEVPEGAVFVGTILHGPWVWHVFK